jgi:hypothetical protein
MFLAYVVAELDTSYQMLAQSHSKVAWHETTDGIKVAKWVQLYSLQLFCIADVILKHDYYAA